MADKDWSKELSKIDKQLESISDEAMFPAKPGATASQKAEVTAARAATSTLGVALRLLLAVALAVGILFWPYQARCGLGLAGYLGAVAVVGVAGIWSGIWSWRHRAGRAHVLSLLLVLWGLALAAIEVLPRIGYAMPDAARLGWSCGPAGPAVRG